MRFHPRTKLRTGRTSRHRGFTLLELMIVLVILVVLIGMVGPRLLGSQKKADLKMARAQIGNLESALELYAVDVRSFPRSEQGLTVLLEPPTEDATSRKWDGPYLDDEIVPVDPWDNAYLYEYPPANGKRDYPNIWSAGPDGEADTDDDIVNWRTSDNDSVDGLAANEIR